MLGILADKSVIFKLQRGLDLVELFHDFENIKKDEIL